MAINATTHDLSLDKVLTNMLSSARNLAEKTEREDGDWRVINTAAHQVMPDGAKRLNDDLWLIN